MKDIDSEASVVWPSWCYSDDIRNKFLETKSDIGRDSSGGETDIHVLPPLTRTTARRNNSAKSAPASSSTSIDDQITQIKSATIEKMLSERSLLLSGYSSNSIDGTKTSCDQSKTPPPISAAQAAALTVTPTTTAAAAAAYLYLEKVKNERMSPRVTAAQIDSLKDAIMESSAAAAAVAAAMANNNNCTSMSNNNNSSNSCSSQSNSSLALSQNQTGTSVNSTADEQLHSHSHLSTATQQQQHLHQSSQMHMNNNHVKRERLSPSVTNGDLQSALSRSRSTTPSSFRGTSPLQSIHNSPSEPVVPMHNLSTNLLNSIQQAASASGRHGTINFPSGTANNPNSGLPSDFSTRNYSDFMRSLAAKYNNSNPNDTSTLRRQTFFDANSNCTSLSGTKKITNSAQKTLYPSCQSTSISKDVTITTTSTLPPPPPLTTGSISPNESGLSHTQHSHMAAAAANVAVTAAAANAASGGSVSPFMTSFLSSLPFSQGIFPPLIDMSSTQALITLARAAKETEIQNILHAAQNAKRSAASVSPSSSPSLNMALQQAAQFISPALIYSAQLQKQQQASRQSSPRATNLSNSTTSSSSSITNKNAADKRNVSPLDLSSQPPSSKRFKPESTSSQSSTDGLLSVTIKRRASSSTATTTPSPPPPPPSLSEKSSIIVASTAAEATTTAAFAPTNVGSSTSAPSSTSTNTSGRQCQAHSEEVNSWTVHDVCEFVGSIDICAEYVKAFKQRWMMQTITRKHTSTIAEGLQATLDDADNHQKTHFREQCIDGSGLPLLTEDHLVNSLGMKLGPALKLRSMLAKKLGGPCPCVTCVVQAQQMLALQTGGVLPPLTATSALNATSTSDSPGSNSNSPKSTITPAKNSGMNCNSPGNSNSSSSKSSINRNDSTTITTTAAATSSNVSATATSNNSIEGGTPTATGNSNCNINIGNFPPAYGTCNNSNMTSSKNNNNNSSSSSSINATGNRDDDADSSSFS